MREYVIRRLFSMVPTLFGLTILSFLIMQLAPGDPLALQLSQSGAQGESSNTRQAFLLQRRQWKLDRPLFLNTRWFSDYSSDARMFAFFQGRSDEELLAELDRLAAGGFAPGSGEAERLEFLADLGIEEFGGLLEDPRSRRETLLPKVKIGIQIRIEEVSVNAVPSYIELLRASDDPRLRIGAIRGLVTATLGDPFTYTYSREMLPSETEAVVTTWRIWWDRAEDRFRPLAPNRRAEVRERFESLVRKESRMDILEGMGAFRKSDAPFFMGVLESEASLKETMVASLALRSHVGKPLRVSAKLTDDRKSVDEVAENWISYYDTNTDRYDPSFPTKTWYLLTDTQYANSLVKLITFDFGKQMVAPHDPVGPKIWETALVSAPIMILSQILVYLLALPSGVLCAVTRGGWTDRLVSLLLFVLYSIPAFVAAMLFLTALSFGKPFKLFPIGGIHSEGYENFSTIGMIVDYLWHIYLPVISLSIFTLAGLAMYSRTSMLEVINQDYIRTARAKGLPASKVILKHALKNSLMPVITLFAYFLPVLLGGSVLIEVIFNIPGMGRLTYSAILEKDYNTMMAILFIDGIIVMISILLTDLLLVVVDPRISFGKSEAAA